MGCRDIITLNFPSLILNLKGGKKRGVYLSKKEVYTLVAEINLGYNL